MVSNDKHGRNVKLLAALLHPAESLLEIIFPTDKFA